MCNDYIVLVLGNNHFYSLMNILVWLEVHGKYDAQVNKGNNSIMPNFLQMIVPWI